MKTGISFLIFFFIRLVYNISIISSFDAKADRIYTDAFEDIYVLSGSSLTKYDFKGRKQCVYNSSNEENISQIDCKNTMKILLFFENRNSIRFLDNQLAEIGDEILLQEKNIYGNVLVCSSESGGVWVFDKSEKTLIKFDAGFRELFRKNLFDADFDAEYMKAENNMLFIKQANKGISVFDNIRNFNFVIEKNIVGDFSVNNSQIQFFDKAQNVFSLYDYETDEQNDIPLPSSIDIKDVRQVASFAVFFDAEKIYISKIVSEKINKP